MKSIRKKEGEKGRKREEKKEARSSHPPTKGLGSECWGERLHGVGARRGSRTWGDRHAARSAPANRARSSPLSFSNLPPILHFIERRLRRCGS